MSIDQEELDVLVKRGYLFSFSAPAKAETS
jgi:hypothetical protein